MLFTASYDTLDRQINAYVFFFTEKPTKKPSRSNRKSVSTTAVPQASTSIVDPIPVTRSRSHSSSTNVLDTMFTPVKRKSMKIKSTDEAETEAPSKSTRQSRRYSVKIQKKTHKI